jgi:uracil-DNA glycosylase
MDRAALASLSREIGACRICRDSPRYGAPLPHEPRPVLTLSLEASICICGQAPGIRAHDAGRPFLDPSGERLRDWLGVSADEFYDPRRFAIVPMGFCFPGYDAKGGDRPPRRECGELWHDRIFAPPLPYKLVVAVGQYAHAYHLGPRRRQSLSETVRHWRDYVDGTGTPILPLPHPSWRNNTWLKKNPWFDEEVIPFLRATVRRLTDDQKTNLEGGCSAE